MYAEKIQGTLKIFGSRNEKSVFPGKKWYKLKHPEESTLNVLNYTCSSYKSVLTSPHRVNQLGNIIVTSSQVENISRVAGKKLFTHILPSSGRCGRLMRSIMIFHNVSVLPYLSSVFIKACIKTMDSPSIAADPWMLDVSWVRNELLTTERTINMNG